MSKEKKLDISCPMPVGSYTRITLAHGGGGRLTRDLIQRLFKPLFNNRHLSEDHDGAEFNIDDARLAFTTDSYVVQPLYFPGGDIGSLSVHGTINDLAMCGAKPLYISAGLIIEEGLELEILQDITQSMAAAAAKANVSVVTGDTKVVQKGRGDRLYINTAGIGIIDHQRVISPSNIQLGDQILLSGDIGRHGIAVISVREGLEFESTIKSDSADLSKMALALLDAGCEVHCMRDCTRGGLATALVELAEASALSIRIEEKKIPINTQVMAACEILGFDPLYVACEGRFIAFVALKDADIALSIMRQNQLGAKASIIGEVIDKKGAEVILRTQIGTDRIIDMQSGEQLPRIC